jgi:N-methylhydantoinase A
LRYARQVHELTTSVHAPTPLTQEGLDQLIADFEALYERKFGKGSAYREAGIEMTLLRLTARGLLKKPEVQKLSLEGHDASAALMGERNIFVEAEGKLAPAKIYNFEKLNPGNRVTGPAVIHTPITTIVLQKGQKGEMDAYRNIVIELEGGA